jgi:two-component system, chemotaxis family, chemotaxis protein CheY
MEQARLTILVVDDDLEAREGMCLVLETEGYIVSQAANGQEALDILTNVVPLPSIIVLDLTMPLLDGRGFLQRRAQDRDLARVPVVIISARTPDNEVLTDVEGFLRKPVEITHLLGLIRRIGARAQ